MGNPLIDPTDLGTFLNDPGIDENRAGQLIGYAQDLCESVLSPLPAAAAGIVCRMAAIAYTSVLSPRAAAAAAAGGQFVGQANGGVVLTVADEADLRRLSGGGGAFSIDLLPVGYVAPYPFWDQIA